MSKKTSAKFEDYVLVGLVIVVVIGAYLFFNKPSTGSLSTDSSLKAVSASAPSVDLKVQEQNSANTPASQNGSGTLQSTITTQGGAVDTTSPCQTNSQLQLLQGGACANQDQVQQQMR